MNNEANEANEATAARSRSQSPLPSAAINYLLDIALGAEYNNSAQVIRKWEEDLRIRVHGSPSASDRAALQAVMDELNAMNLGIRLRFDAANPNVNLYFVPERQFSRYEPNYRPVNLGYAWIRWRSYRIHNATVLISTTGTSPQERAHLIREELTQSLGLLRDSYQYPDSIFYQNWTDTTAYNELDKAIIQALYNPAVRPGMTRSQVLTALNSRNFALSPASPRRPLGLEFQR